MARHRIVAAALLVMCSASSHALQPHFKLRSTAKSVQKGHVFGILLQVKTDVQLNAVTIQVTPPENFCAAADSLAGVRGMLVSSNVVVIPTLSAQSEITIPYRVVPPNEIMLGGTACSGAKRETYDAMGDDKVFVFNFSYMEPGDTTPHLWTDTLDVKYTTSNSIFIGGGMLGVLLGFVVKTLTKSRPDGERGTSESSGWVGRHLPFLVTTSVIGLGALLGIAEKGLPASGVVSAVATGIGLGILSDEALISKFKGSPKQPERSEGPKA